MNASGTTGSCEFRWLRTFRLTCKVQVPLPYYYAVKGVLYRVMTLLSDNGPRPFYRRVGSSVRPAYLTFSSPISLRSQSLWLQAFPTRLLLVFPTISLTPFNPLISTQLLPFFVSDRLFEEHFPRSMLQQKLWRRQEVDSLAIHTVSTVRTTPHRISQIHADQRNDIETWLSHQSQSLQPVQLLQLLVKLRHHIDDSKRSRLATNSLPFRALWNAYEQLII